MKDKLSNKTISIVCVMVVGVLLGIVIASSALGGGSANNNTAVYSNESGVNTSSNSAAALGDFYSKEPSSEVTTKIAISEWGFDNSDEWGNKLVEVIIDSNNNNIFKNEKGKFVIIRENARFWEFYPEKEQVVFSSWYYHDKIVNDDAGFCTNLDNDTLSLKLYSEGGGVLSIVDRKVVDTCVVFKIHDHSDRYYIPYSLLDLNKEPELYQENSSYKYYKVYVK